MRDGEANAEQKAPRPHLPTTTPPQQGMALVPSVTELLVAEMLYLQYDDPRKPIYLYINSAGVVGGKRGSRLGYETEALSIYDTMRHVKPPIRTLCVGTAYGEAALLLAAGEKGTRAALPSASIMLRQPMQRYAQMQASDVDIYRKEMRKTKAKLVSVWVWEREKGKKRNIIIYPTPPHPPTSSPSSPTTPAKTWSS